jgi:hypothetical protein
MAVGWAVGWVVAWAVVTLATALLAPRARADMPPPRPMIAAVVSPAVDDTGIIKIRLKNFDTVDVGADYPKSFRLRLDGHRLDGILPQFMGQDEVAFDLSSLEKDDQANWLALVGSPPALGIKPVEIGIATADADLPEADGQRVIVSLRVFSATQALLVFFAILLLAGLVWRYGPKTAMLRDPPAADTPEVHQRPYSLARCQMAFWLVVLTVSFVVIVGITGQYNGIVTQSSLTLLGISSLTAFGAESIDVAKSAKKRANAAPGTAPPAPNAPVHTTFLQDLLTDDSGFALHRVQILVWTLVLGAVSLWSVYRALTLPDFDSNLLVMMGISSGLYLGFKWPEQQTDRALPQTTDGAVPAE